MKIMLAGKKGSGKDAAASFLITQYGGYTLSFAQPLYDMLYFCQYTMHLEKSKDRKFLTTVGDHFREQDPAIFVNLCMDKAYAMAKEANVYITDGRYINELNAGKAEGFYIIQLVADNSIRQDRRPNESIVDSHSSENGYPNDYPFDFTIVNDGSIEDLYAQLESIVAIIVEEGKQVIF